MAKKSSSLGGCFFLVVAVVLVAVFGGEFLKTADVRVPAATAEEDPAAAAREAERRAAAQRDSDAWDEENESAEAWIIAKDMVTNQLKSPSSADFGGFFGDQNRRNNVNQVGENQFHVVGWVDAQNSFGATIRTDWKIILTREGSQWKAAYFEIGDELILDTGFAKQYASATLNAETKSLIEMIERGEGKGRNGSSDLRRLLKELDMLRNNFAFRQQGISISPDWMKRVYALQAEPWSAETRVCAHRLMALGRAYHENGNIEDAVTQDLRRNCVEYKKPSKKSK